jgi:hypothetical protein
MAREELMKAKELKRRCANITMAFDQFEMRPELRYGGTMQAFSIDVSENKKFIEDVVSKCYENGDSKGDEGTKLENTLCDLETNLFNIGFALGYCIGQDFDVPYPEIQKDIQAIKQLLRQEKLLPYFSREREVTGSKSPERRKQC